MLTLIIINNNKILIIHIINKFLQYRMLVPSIHKIQIYHTNILMRLMSNIIKIMMNNLIISGIIVIPNIDRESLYLDEIFSISSMDFLPKSTALDK